MFRNLLKKRRVYLDVAAGISANPSSQHDEGMEARRVLEKARTEIARLTEVQANDVIFTSGATEANALAILGILRSRQKIDKKIHALYLPSAHASLVENMKIAESDGVEIEPLPILGSIVNTERLKKMLRPETALISMDAVCGETGVVWNTLETKRALNEYYSSAVSRAQHAYHTAPLLHVDASQAPFTEKLQKAHFGADLLVLDASKVGMVRGIGALIASRAFQIEPLYGGGGQERGLRPGSEMSALARDFAAALRAAATKRDSFRARAVLDRTRIISRIIKSIPNVVVNEGQRQVPHILNFSILERDTDYLAAILNDKGFAVSTKSACESGSTLGSRAVFAMTLNAERAATTLRISWGPNTRSSDLKKFAEALTDAVVFIDSYAKW